MGDTRMVAGRSRSAPPRISSTGNRASRPAAGGRTVERCVHGGEYRLTGQRCGDTIVLWHRARIVGRVTRTWAGRWVLYPMPSCRGRLTGATAGAILADTVRAFGLRQPVGVR